MFPRRSKFFFGVWLIKYWTKTKEFANWSLSPSASSLCFREEENIDHLFIQCPSASGGWNLLLNTCCLPLCLPNSVMKWIFEALNGRNLNGKIEALWKIAVQAYLWEVWREGNRRVLKICLIRLTLYLFIYFLRNEFNYEIIQRDKKLVPFKGNTKDVSNLHQGNLNYDFWGVVNFYTKREHWKYITLKHPFKIFLYLGKFLHIFPPKSSIKQLKPWWTIWGC